MHATTKWWRSLLTIGVLWASPMALAKVWILEFVADNDGGYADEDGASEDWIELYNDADTVVDLSGWSLTDDSADLQKWVFPPGASIGPDQHVVVFASGKNRRLAGSELHTNFSLRSSGEYLGLVQADGVTVEHHYSPSYPAQFSGASYGLSQAGPIVAILAQGATGQAGVPVSEADFNSNYVNWNDAPETTFSGSNWQAIKTGVGYDRGSGYSAWLDADGDLESEMFGKNASVFIRLPFNLVNPESVSVLTLRMRWDDGFAAYVNGVQVAADRVPVTLEWDSSASADRTDDLNDDWVIFNLDLSGVTLMSSNILAIHGLNRTVISGDMLILPELDARLAGSLGTTPGFLLTPTPAAVNGTVATSVPPVFLTTTDSVPRPAGGSGSAKIMVTSEISPGTQTISEVSLRYRKSFESEITVTMNDSGSGDDETANDGIWSASIPTTSLDPGEMLRWRVVATDSIGNSSTSPAYADPQDADQYYGTVAINPAHDLSDLTIMETFVLNESAVDTRAGGRASIYYLGQFYDNVQMDLHGQSTASFPKKSYDLDFNRGDRFLWKEGERKAKDVNLLTNFADKSKMRNKLAYEYLKRAGAGYHYAFPIRVDRNGAFFSTTDLVEDGDDRYLERIGLDEEGALYKMYDGMVDVNTAVKKTRGEEGRTDLQALFDGVDDSQSIALRRRYVYDHIDIAASINQLAAYNVAGISDNGHKNYYLYRDTNGTGEWRPLPWDVDLSFGRRWRAGLEYFNDDLITDFSNWTNPNDLWDLMHNTAEYREMFLRRCDTLRDDLSLSNAVANAGPDWISDLIIDTRTQIGNDADLDYTKWGSWGNNFTMQQGTDQLLNTYFPARRNFIFSSGFNLGGVQVPSDQPSSPNITIDLVDFLPMSGDQYEEFIILKNNDSSTDIDLSGWTLSGAVTYTFPAGTVILNGAGNATSQYRGLLHIARDPLAFRARATGPTGGEFRYVQGPYGGQLSARGETIELRTADGTLIDSFGYASSPTAAQLGLRVTEVNYHPADPTASETSALAGLTDSDFEFIELKNISGNPISLSGASIIDGVEFTFGSGLSLSAGSRIILSKNPAAFAIRYPAITTTVVGPYFGLLDNDGETIRLVDDVGENILVFTYNDRWYPPSDGAGKSLVIRVDATAYDALSDPAMWAASDSFGGTPGSGDSTFQEHFNAWQEAWFAMTNWETSGAPDADPDNDGLLNWEEYAFATNPDVSDQALFHSRIIMDGGVASLGAEVRRRINGADLIWSLEVSSTLSNDWVSTMPVLVSSTNHGNSSETVILREESETGVLERRFLRLKVKFDP